MRYGRIGAVVAVIFAILAGEWLWLKSESNPPRGDGEPVITTRAAAPGGPFSLIDHAGLPVTERAYRGKYLLMVFGYTNCPDVCPTTLNSIAATMELLGPDAEAIQPLFVTVDPDRDTPEVLAEYVAAFHPRMIGLTGSAEQIRQVAQAYRVYYSKVETGDDTYPVDHSAYVYFAGPDGAVLTYLKHDAAPEAMAAAIEKAMAAAMEKATTRPTSAAQPAQSAAIPPKT